MQVSGKRIVK